MVYRIQSNTKSKNKEKISLLRVNTTEIQLSSNFLNLAAAQLLMHRLVSYSVLVMKYRD